MLKSLPALLIALVLAGSACAQGMFVYKAPPEGYSMSRDPDAGERMTVDSSGAASSNTTNWNAINDKMHMSTGGIKNDVVLAPGRWYHDGQLRIGINSAETSIKAGGTLIGSGGSGNFLNNNHTSVLLGTETRIVNTSTTDANSDTFTDGQDLLYGGYGWNIGNYSLFGFDLPDNTAWTNRDSSQKKAVGLRVQASAVSGAPNGSFLNAAPMCFMGYHDAILVQPKTGTSAQANNLYWQRIIADTCDTIYHINDGQSVTHEIYAWCPAQYCDRGIYMERGGHVHVHSAEITYANHIVAEIGDNYHINYGALVIDNIKLDNNATGTTLLKLGTYNGQKRAVFITGSVGASVTFDGSGACQGINSNDQVFIRFTGDPTNAATLNAYSTVDANGNYLE